MKEHLRELEEDRDCAVQAFQDTLFELNQIKDKIEEVSDKEIVELWNKHSDSGLMLFSDFESALKELNK